MTDDLYTPEEALGWAYWAKVVGFLAGLVGFVAWAVFTSMPVLWSL